MNFVEMLKELEAGKCIRRSAWKYEEGYLKLMMGFNTVWKILTIPSANAGNHLFTMDDFNATDWHVIDSYSVQVKEEVKSETAVVQ
jgi:hypothetical protein